jgi:hypothetical protein
MTSHALYFNRYPSLSNLYIKSHMTSRGTVSSVLGIEAYSKVPFIYNALILTSTTALNSALWI